MTQFAFVFPGQGSQKLGMLRTLYDENAHTQNLFAKANDVLGYDLWDVIQNDETKLNQTEFTQPALLASGIAVYDTWCETQNLKPTVVAGHSLGEYTALVASGVLSFEDAILTVAKRGEFMQKASPDGLGAMGVILSLDNDTVLEICAQFSEIGSISPANYNSPGQVVIAGVSEAVDAALQFAKGKGAKMAKRIDVSVPSHCDLMKEAAIELGSVLNTLTIKVPQIPVIHNVDCTTHSNADEIKQALISQLYEPVRWVETVEKIVSMGVTHIIECGPGKVLTGLNKRIDKNIEVGNMDDLASIHQISKQLGVSK